MTESRIVKALREAWVDTYILPHVTGDGDPADAKPADAWLTRSGPRIIALVAKAFARSPLGGPAPGTLSDADLRKAEAHLRETLDLRPVGAKALQVIRPTWPETLAQLKAQIEGAVVHEVKQNPAPKLRAETAPQKQHLAYSAGRALYRLHEVQPETQADYDAIDGIAWRLSAPEGFPPAPRRGGVYSYDEAQAIRQRLLKSWEVVREIARAGAAKDAERAELGIPSEVVPRVLDSYKATSLRDWTVLRTVGEPGDLRIPDAEGKSPKDFHTEVLAWGRDRVFPVLAEVARLDMGVFMPWPDPDAHVQALASNEVTQYSIAAVAAQLYGLTRYTVDWSQWLGPAAKSIQPAGHVAVPGTTYSGYSPHWPLSKLIEVQRLSSRAYDDSLKAREAAKQRDLDAALPKLRAMLARGLQFSKANIERALPGYKVHVREGWRSYTVGIVGPSGEGYLAAGTGTTIGASLAQVEKALGLSGAATTKQNPAAPDVAAIRAALTPELLKEPYRSRVLRGECSPLTGHCYVASEAYYHLHGGKAAGLKPMSIQHEGGPHWWIRDASGRDIDLTAEQFTTPVPYAQGVGKGFLTTAPSKRAQVVMDRVTGAPKANPAEPAWLSLATALAVEPFIESSGISEVARSPRGFLRAYEAAGGAPGRLGQDAHSGQDWRSRRNAFVARHVAQAKANGEPWWQDGAPTGRHLALIAWAYTPTPDRLHAWVRKTNPEVGKWVRRGGGWKKWSEADVQKEQALKEHNEAQAKVREQAHLDRRVLAALDRGVPRVPAELAAHLSVGQFAVALSLRRLERDRLL